MVAHLVRNHVAAYDRDVILVRTHDDFLCRRSVHAVSFNYLSAVRSRSCLHKLMFAEINTLQPVQVVLRQVIDLILDQSSRWTVFDFRLGVLSSYSATFTKSPVFIARLLL